MIPRTMLLLCAMLVSVTHGARILGVFPMASLSHQIVYQPVWRELSVRGHQVTVITPNPLEDPTLKNLTEIDVSVLYKPTENFTASFTTEITHWDMVEILAQYQIRVWEDMMAQEEVQKLLADDTKQFDLVILEFYTPLLSAFAYKYKCPFVGLTSAGVMTTVHETMGNPAHPLAYPNIMFNYGDEMPVFKKMQLVAFAVYERLLYYNYFLPLYDKHARKYFGEGMPYMGDLERNISMLLLNTNPVLHTARPKVPGVVELGMMHIKPKKPLPEVS